MTRPYGRALSVTLTAAAAAGLGIAVAIAASLPSQKEAKRSAEKYLYVWAGDQARKAPDFVAVVEFDPSSKA